jgi:conjugative transfer region protein TrbK
MTSALTFRLAAIGFALLALLLAALQTRHPAPVPAPVTTAPATSVVDPVRLELERCQGLGEDGAREPACLRAWADQRRRFLGLSKTAER